MRKIKMSLFVSLILMLSFALYGCGQNVSQGNIKCTILIDCSAINANKDKLDPAKVEFVPEDGCVLAKCEVYAHEGDTVFDVLRDTCEAKDIQMESSFSPLYKSYYIKGINNLYEFDCGANSGWMFSVNGEFPNYGCSSVEPKEGDEIVWVYTCDLGSDVGGDFEK